MQVPDVAILHTSRFPREVFADFERLVASPRLQLAFDEREEDGPYASVEWLIPTAVIAYIGKSYFDGFLKEAGKDHYAVLKSGLKSLYSKLVGPEAPKVTVVSTQGKTKDPQIYSLVFSLLAEAGPKARIKLLIRNGASSAEYEDTIRTFLEFVSAHHEGTLDPHVLQAVDGVRVVGETLLVAYNPSTGQIEPVDPSPRPPASAA